VGAPAAARTGSARGTGPSDGRPASSCGYSCTCSCRPTATPTAATAAATAPGFDRDVVSAAPATAQLSAMGTGVTLAVVEPSRLVDALQVVTDELSAVDRACSRFRLDSDLSRINHAAGKWVQVSPLCLEAIEVALRAAEVTDGLVDPTVGGAVEAAGYIDDFAVLPKDGPPVSLNVGPIPGWHRVQINRRTGRVRVASEIRLDLGATAKSLAADRAASAAAAAAGTGVIVSCGGDVASAGNPPPGGWPVRVCEHHADPPDAPSETVLIDQGGLATSGVVARHWQRGGQTLHHIIDPATSLPADTPWRVVTVAAATCVDANIASPAAVILGIAAPAWLSERGLAARLVHADGSVLRVGGWPEAVPA
jgi:FAD:protein FMN transferase